MNENIKFPRYLKWLLGLIILGVAFFVLFNWTIDPFQFYRKSWLTPTFNFNQRYQNPGLAKHYDFDTVIIGNSYSENFMPSHIQDTLGYHTLKLAVEGGSLREQYLTLKFALETEKVNNVIWVLDINQLQKPPLDISENFPLYLYDHNLLNDYPYLFSSDVFLRSIHNILVNLNLIHYPWTLETINTWHNQFVYDEENIWSRWKPISCKKSSIIRDVQPYLDGFNFNIFSLIEQYPEVHYHFIFPPFSILRLLGFDISGELDAHHQVKAQILSQTQIFSNVRIFDFTTAGKITMDLDNYRDTKHYSKHINQWMIDQMALENYLITPDTLDEAHTMLKQQIETYIAQHKDQICRRE